MGNIQSKLAELQAEFEESDLPAPSPCDSWEDYLEGWIETKGE